MKEFVEKLIERLENEILQSTEAKAEAIMGMCGASANACFGEVEAYNKAIKITKDLASEHNNDFCVWEDTESLREKGVCYGSDGLYKPGCNDDEDDFRDWNWIRHFEFCPYCGKKIKVVE